MNYKEEYKKIDEQINELKEKKRNILVQAVESKGLKVDTKFKINNMGVYKDKYFKVIDEVTFYQLTKTGTINKSVSYLKFNFSILDNVQIVED